MRQEPSLGRFFAAMVRFAMDLAAAVGSIWLSARFGFRSGLAAYAAFIVIVLAVHATNECICGAAKWPTAMYCFDCDKAIPRNLRAAIARGKQEEMPWLWLVSSAQITASPSFQARIRDFGRYLA